MSKENISFSKTMAKTHVSVPFQLNLPKEFCEEHLCHNSDVILVDESDREYGVRFLISKNVLSNGWRGFATTHGLQRGDNVVFHLVDRCKFKVHIIRASRSIDEEFQNVMPLTIVKREDLTEGNACYGNTVAQMNPVSQIVHSHQMEVTPFEKVYVRRKYRSIETKGSYDTDSAALSRIENSESALSLKCFEDFKICVNGDMLDSEIPADVRIKYYELCCVQKRCLHSNVMKDLNSNLVVSMIQDIVSIAESAKATSISTSHHHLASMDKTLKSFQDLGMTVGSLRGKIHTLIKILNKHHSVAESKIVRLEALECERKSFLAKKTKNDKLLESAMAQGKLIGRLEENVDCSDETMDTLSLMLKEVAELT